MLSTGGSSIVLDCGIRTQRDCRALLTEHAARISGVVVSHSHGDHVCYSALRVLQSFGTPVHCHESVFSHVQRKHLKDWDGAPAIHTFTTQRFQIGEFEIQPIELKHEPNCPTFGFVVWAGSGTARRKIIVCTDFCDYSPLLEHLPGADFVFVEANHDLELLRRYFNYASLFHMSNPKTGDLLVEATRGRQFAPQRVMLGHLSEQRNTEQLAMDSIRQRFTEAGIGMPFPMDVAPRYAPSRTISIE